MDAKATLKVSYIKSIIIQTDSNTIIILHPDEVEIHSEPLYDEYKLYNWDRQQFTITGISSLEQIKIS